MPSKKTAYTPPISDESVKAKTGYTWAEWFKQLDAAGAAKLGHVEIVTIARERFGAGPWWQQMVAVTYEQARGLREKHETASGYQVSVSRTVNVPVARLYRAWKDARARAPWLGKAELTVRKATPEKSLRITWADGSHVDVGLYPKGEAKSQVMVQQSKLPNVAAVKRQKAFWTQALDTLKARLEA